MSKHDLMLVMAKNIQKKQTTTRITGLDSVYFLKILLFLILGTMWVRIVYGDIVVPMPLGLAIGIVLATHERFKIDRKFEYAILLVATFVAFWLPLGFEIIVR